MVAPIVNTSIARLQDVELSTCISNLRITLSTSNYILVHINYYELLSVQSNNYSSYLRVVLYFIVYCLHSNVITFDVGLMEICRSRWLTLGYPETSIARTTIVSREGPDCPWNGYLLRAFMTIYSTRKQMWWVSVCSDSCGSTGCTFVLWYALSWVRTCMYVQACMYMYIHVRMYVHVCTCTVEPPHSGHLGTSKVSSLLMRCPYCRGTHVNTVCTL